MKLKRVAKYVSLFILGGAVAVTASVSIKLKCSKSIPEYLYHESKINPIVNILQSKYLAFRAKSLSEKWLGKVSYLDIEDIPDIEWEEDSTTSKGLDSFFYLDEFAEEVRPLVVKERNLSSNDIKWHLSHFGEGYFHDPASAPTPRYWMETTNDGKLRVQTDIISDRWVYLASKEKQPSIFALDFDFITYRSNQETLQICFASSSLADRFRFNLENNATLKFDVVDEGRFIYFYRKHSWDNFKIPFSIPEGFPVHIRLECVENNFILYIDNDIVMAIHVDSYIPKENNWYLIFWTGINPQPNQNIDIEVSNFKILHTKDLHQ